MFHGYIVCIGGAAPGINLRSYSLSLQTGCPGLLAEGKAYSIRTML